MPIYTYSEDAHSDRTVVVGRTKEEAHAALLKFYTMLPDEMPIEFMRPSPHAGHTISGMPDMTEEEAETIFGACVLGYSAMSATSGVRCERDSIVTKLFLMRRGARAE